MGTLWPETLRVSGNMNGGTYFSVFTWIVLIVASTGNAHAENQFELAGVTVTPHIIASQMRYRRDPDPELGARVQLFLHNRGSEPMRIRSDSEVTLGEVSPDELVANDQWSWHDFPSAWPQQELELPADSMTVWSFNGNRTNWGVGANSDLVIGTALRAEINIDQPTAWISAATFLSNQDEVNPDTLVLHIANEHDFALRIVGCRLWLPESNRTWRTLHRGAMHRNLETWPNEGVIPAHDKGIVRVKTGPLPLTYGAIELQVESNAGSTSQLWTHLRIKREAFDISGGWVQGGVEGANPMTFEPWLKALRRMHINTAHLADHIPGYTDQTEPGGLYQRYPLKYFNRLWPPQNYESLNMLARVHAVEFLGEPQYGGGRPVPPMDVWRKLAPYQSTKLPTSVTHSEERIWRYYSGLSDYPHYDAYRVCAPSPDAWFKYDRWEGKKIAWGAPLETIGDMCRSLRELNRPMPTAYWSQGPHSGWGPSWGRRRASPTPDELRLQAYHALASRITSLYWFNLSIDSVIKYRDTLNEITRVGREMRLLSELYLTGDAYRTYRVEHDGELDWDLASIICPDATLLFALDLDYEPDSEQKVFQFGLPRSTRLTFSLPPWSQSPAEVFRIDADGVYEVAYQMNAGRITITDRLAKVGVYVVSTTVGTADELEARRQELLTFEAGFDFDPANNDDDFATLVEFANQDQKP